MIFIKDLNKDEIRSGWLVQSDMKKVWNCWLEIWAAVDMICRKHEINYWANEETLLGAIRHEGFVPWCGKMTFCMMRPDFNRFCEIIDTELRGGTFEIGEKNFFHLRIYNMLSTFIIAEGAIETDDPKGLAIDIFPLDIAFDGTREAEFAEIALEELLGTVYNFSAIAEHVQNGGFIVNKLETLESLHAATPDEQVKYLNTCAEKFFEFSSAVNYRAKIIYNKNLPLLKKEWFRETIYLPFESVELPVPIDYDKILGTLYADWHMPSRDEIVRHNGIFSADIPYQEALKFLNMEMVFGLDDDKEHS